MHDDPENITDEPDAGEYRWILRYARRRV